MARAKEAKRSQVSVYLAPAVVAELTRRAAESSRNAMAEVRPPTLAAGLLSMALGFNVDGSPLEPAPVPSPVPPATPPPSSPKPSSPKPGKAPRLKGAGAAPPPRTARKVGR